MENKSDKKDHMTLGEFRLGVNFNPSGKSEVDELKGSGADIIDMLDATRDTIEKNDPLAGETHRTISMAQSLIEEGVMLGVKALTRKTANVVIVKPEFIRDKEPEEKQS
jgi:hypothetical protein